MYQQTFVPITWFTWIFAYNGRICAHKVNFFKINAQEPVELVHQWTAHGPIGEISLNVPRAVEVDSKQEAEWLLPRRSMEELPVKEMLSNPLLVMNNLAQRIANGTNTDPWVNAVQLAVVEHNTEKEQKSKKQNMVEPIVPAWLEKNLLATLITALLTVSLLTGETLPRVQNHVMVELRPGKEVSKQLLPLAELNAPEIPRKHNLAIPKIVQLTVNGTLGVTGTPAAWPAEEEWQQE
jgi:hypothetical protein